MTTPEGNILSAICRWLDTLKPGCKYLKIHGGIYQERGTPDLLVVRHGTTFMWEIKARAGRVSKLQHHRMKEWHLAGANTSVIRSVAQAKRSLGVVECGEDRMESS